MSLIMEDFLDMETKKVHQLSLVLEPFISRYLCQVPIFVSNVSNFSFTLSNICNLLFLVLPPIMLAHFCE